MCLNKCLAIISFFKKYIFYKKIETDKLNSSDYTSTLLFDAYISFVLSLIRLAVE